MRVSCPGLHTTEYTHAHATRQCWKDTTEAIQEAFDLVLKKDTLY